jgi:hypothetical protein
MPKTVPSTVFFVHDSDKIDLDGFYIDSMLLTIEKHRTFECTALSPSECIERMSVELISSESNLEKYIFFIFLCDNIDLSSLDLVVTIDEMVTMSFEILDGYIFTFVSDGTTRGLHDLSDTFFEEFSKLFSEIFACEGIVYRGF